MRNIIILSFLIVFSCKQKSERSDTIKGISTTVSTEEYELVKASNSKALLILFPGGGSTSKETKEEFDILKTATDKNISVLLMNFNRHLWIDEQDSEQLTEKISEAIEKNDLKKEKIYIGGISIGGNVALSLSDYLHRSKSGIEPEGIFVVDSPIDLYALYESEQKDVKRKDLSDERLAEPKFVIELIEDEFGVGDTLLTGIQKLSPITLKMDNLGNIRSLRDSKLRFYTEPDTLWWENVRQMDFESTNAHTLQTTSERLEDENWNGFQLIQTKDKSYRSNGERHSHSWSIVDPEELTDWILE